MAADFGNLLMLAEVSTSASLVLSTSITTLPNNNIILNSHNKKRKMNDSNNNSKKIEKSADYNMPYKKLTIENQNPSPHGWIEAHLRLKATNFIWAFEKELTSTDIDPHQNRLLFPTSSIGQTLLPALTPQQRYKLEKGTGIECVTLDHRGRDWFTRFNYWKSSGCYTLNGKWTSFIKANGLRARFHTVRVWAFHHGPKNQHLGFMIFFNHHGHEQGRLKSCHRR